MTDPVTADGPSFGVDEAVERLRLSREQYGLLGLLLGLVVVIALVSYQSSRDVGQQTASLSEYLQTVSGDRVSLERQVVIFALEVERWRNDELTSEELELSFGLVERQRRVAQDEADGRILGTASVVFDIGAHSDLIGEFGRLAVHPDARGRGVGKLLMDPVRFSLKCTNCARLLSATQIVPSGASATSCAPNRPSTAWIGLPCSKATKRPMPEAIT